MKRLFAPVLILLAVVGAMSACSSGDGNSEASFNKADVEFVQGMIPHHSQAIEMAKLASTRAETPEVKALATRIEDAQDPEIKQMRSWLKEWDEPEKSMAGDGMGAGMMSGADMDKLRAAKGADFDEMFLTMMIVHHKGAVGMAQTERQDGKNADAKKLAADIIETQEAEIVEMTGLLESSN